MTKQIGLNQMEWGEIKKVFKSNPQLVEIFQRLESIVNEPEQEKKVATIGTYRIRKNADGTISHITEIYAGFKNGKADRRSFSGKTFEESQSRAWAGKLKIEEEGEAPVSKRLKQPTVGEWFEHWLEIIKIKVRANTRSSYKKKLEAYVLNAQGDNATLPQIKNIKLAQLDVHQVEELFNAMMQRGLSGRTIAHLRSIMSNSLNEAIRKKLIRHNVLDTATPIKIAKSNNTYLTREELARLVTACEGNKRAGDFVLMLAYTGARLEEVRALTWEDIDFVSGDVRYNKSIVAVNGQGLTLEDLKNEASARTFQLDPINPAFEMLKERKLKRAEELLFVGEGLQESESIFIYGDGNWYGDRYLRNSYAKIKAEAGIVRRGVGFHTLRHTFATLSLDSGVNAHEVQEMLGHSDIKTTLGTYAHVLKGASRKASSILIQSLDDARDSYAR